MTESRSSKSKAVNASPTRPEGTDDSLEIATRSERGRPGGNSTIRARVSEFAYPPVHDGVIIGKTAQLGLAAFRKALDLLVAVPFVHVHFDDDEIIGDLLIRHAVLRRIDKTKLVAFIMKQIKPLMSSEEILHLDLHIEVEIDEDSP